MAGGAGVVAGAGVAEGVGVADGAGLVAGLAVVLVPGAGVAAGTGGGGGTGREITMWSPAVAAVRSAAASLVCTLPRGANCFASMGAALPSEPAARLVSNTSTAEIPGSASPAAVVLG